jgi:MipA family protein
MKNLLKIAVLWLVAHPAQAQDQASADVRSADQTPAQEAPLVLPDERRWRLGAALGYGERSNPLIQSDDIPVVLDLDIAYFGDRWFFDNGDLGVSLTDNQLLTANLVARLNSDRTFFGKTNLKYVTFQQLAGGASQPLRDEYTGQVVTQPQPLNPPDRDYAIEAGIEALFGGDWGQSTLRAFHDVSGTHEGYEIAADYSYRITRGRLSLSPVLGISWKSAELSNYYWGVHEDEDSLTLQAYEARAGLGWEAGLRASYYLTRHIRLAASATYERLQHSVAQSPLVGSDHVFGYFAGVGWQF